jgi:hypothetical protein
MGNFFILENRRTAIELQSKVDKTQKGTFASFGVILPSLLRSIALREYMVWWGSKLGARFEKEKGLQTKIYNPLILLVGERIRTSYPLHPISFMSCPVTSRQVR